MAGRWVGLADEALIEIVLAKLGPTSTSSAKHVRKAARLLMEAEGDLFTEEEREE